MDWLTERPIAHRGLHTMKGVRGESNGTHRPENALSAFSAAVARGYAIECDLQPTRDGDVVVFHDRTLDRMTGRAGEVREHDAAYLADIHLANGSEGIPRLSELLELVDGRVPLVLELKGEGADPDAFVRSVANALNGYDGPVAAMSFLSPITDRFAEHMPDVPRGLTAEGDDRAFEAHTRAMKSGDLHFISYDVNALPCRLTREARENGVPVICWTVQTPEQVALSRAHADQMTFEGFLPDAKAERPATLSILS